MLINRYRLLLTVAAFCATNVSSPLASAQPSGPRLLEESANRHRHDQKDDAIRVEVRLVLVPVTVTDALGRIVHGLARESFKLYEDRVLQPITSFSSVDTPASVGLVFDLSGSMGDKIDEARRAANAFWGTANPDDEVFLVTFADRAELQMGFTTDFAEVQDKLLFARAHGKTALIDGIQLAMRQLRKARNSRRALLVVSDGGDNNSRLSESELLSIAREADVQIYGIGIHDNPRAPEEAGGTMLLEKLSQATGGLHFVVRNPDDLRDIAAKIGVALHDQYLIGYYPPPGPEGKWREIRVQIAAPKQWPRLQVYARRGYYGPTPPQ